MLDLRLPVGIFFLMIGAVLLVDGLLHPLHSPGTNIILNRDWGLCLLVFGALMTLFGSINQRSVNREEQATPQEPPQSPQSPP